METLLGTQKKKTAKPRKKLELNREQAEGKKKSGGD